MGDMRIRVRLPTDILEQLKKISTDSKISLNKLIEHILRDYLLKKGRS